MRKSTQQVFDAWKQGKRNQKQQGLWTDGENIFSYSTIILFKDVENVELVLNVTKYSHTTTVHQNGLKELLHMENFNYITVDDVERGEQRLIMNEGGN